jgi:ornithine cyclodeaminase
MKLVDAATADRLLDFPSLIEALRDGHRGPITDSGRLLLNADADAFLAMAAWQRGSGFGVKLATVFPGNAARGKPNIASVYVLFSDADGSVQAVIDATPLTVRKTAADSALGADYLARADARTLLVIGAGAQARWQIEAFRTVRPSLARVLIWNRSAERAVALAQTIDVEPVADLPSAVAQADIVTCVTASEAPVLYGAWLRPGTHVDLVGGYTPAMREADDEAVRRARVFVDTRWFTLHDAGDICQPLQNGTIAEADVLGDLFQLVRGAVPGRTNGSEITLFKNAGGGHLDLMAARLIATRLG